MKKMLKKVVSLSLASMLLLSSCGENNGNGSNNSGSSDNGSASSYVQGVTDESVKVGNSIAVSGALAPVGVPYKNGMEAYFLMVNENGGIDGRMIEYAHQDDEFNPEKGKAALEKMVYDEEVFALVGHFGTPIVGATLNDIVDIGIPSVYFATGTGILYNEEATGNERALFPVQPVYPMEGRIMASWAKGEFDASKIGVIYTGDDAGKDLLKGIEQESEVLGLEVVSEQVNVGDVDVSSAVTKIKDANVDLVIIAAIQNTFPQVAKELAKQGAEIDVLTTYVNADVVMVQSIQEDVGTKFDVYANAWVDLTSDELQVYTEWVSKVSNEDLSANAYAMTGWIAASFFVEGLRRLEGEEVTWESYIDAMESAPVSNPFGGELDFANGSRLGTGEMALVKMNIEEESGWEVSKEIMSMEQIINQN